MVLAREFFAAVFMVAVNLCAAMVLIILVHVYFRFKEWE